jgi:hypothetical protein
VIARRADQLVTPFLRAQPDLLNGINRMIVVQSCLKKYFAFAVGQIISRTPAVLSRGGALPSSRTLGWDAVDVDGVADEQR